MQVVHRAIEQKAPARKTNERQKLIDALVIKITLENNARVRAKRELANQL